MCFASPVNIVDAGSPDAREGDYLFNNSHTAGFAYLSTPSCSTPEAPARNNECGSSASCGHWHVPYEGRSTAAAVLGSSIDSDQPGSADSACILQDIVKTSLSLHSCLSVSASGQAGGWCTSRSHFVPGVGNSSLKRPATSNCSKCVPSVSCDPKRHHSNSLQLSFTANKDHDNSCQHSSSSLATAAPAGGDVCKSSMHAMRPQPLHAVSDEAQSLLQAPEVSNSILGHLSYCNMQLQLQEWLDGVEANPAPDSMQYTGVAYGGLHMQADRSAVPQARGPSHDAPVAGLPAPAFVLLGMF